jgi:hypothetical protein
VIDCGARLLWLRLHLETPPPDEAMIELSAWIVPQEGGTSQVSDLGIGPLAPWHWERSPPIPWESLGEDLFVLQLGNHQQELQDWVKLTGDELLWKGSGLKRRDELAVPGDLPLACIGTGSRTTRQYAHQDRSYCLLFSMPALGHGAEFLAVCAYH